MFKLVRSALLCICFIAQSHVYANALRKIFNEEEALKLYSICQKINSKDKLTPAQLLFHNDRGIFDCAGTYCFCKELSERPISRKEEKKAIEAIKCILVYVDFDLKHQVVIDLLKKKFNQEEIDFLNEFDALAFIKKIDRIVLQTKLELCVIQ